jgi:copper chaperone CopZ
VETLKIKIEGMSCLDCAIRVQRALGAVPSVKCVRVAVGLATVEHESALEEQLLQAIQTAGNYKGAIETPSIPRQIPQPREWMQTAIKAAVAKII